MHHGCRDPVHFCPWGKDWSFAYRGADFVCHTAQLTMPDTDTLDAMVDGVERLRPAMAARLLSGWEGFPDVRIDDGETWHINLGAFGADGTFEVSWAGGTSWGDMGIDFAMKDGEIVGESWGD